MKYFNPVEPLQQIEDQWRLSIPVTSVDRIKFLKREFKFLSIFLKFQSFTNDLQLLQVTEEVQALFEHAELELRAVSKIDQVDGVIAPLQDEVWTIKSEIKAVYSFPRVFDWLDPLSVMEFIDSVVENLGDLLKIYGHDSLLFIRGPKKQLGDVFKELKFLRNFVCFASDKRRESDYWLDGFFIHCLGVAGDAAMAAWLYLPSKADILLSDLLLTKIKPTQPDVREIYIDVLEYFRWRKKSPRHPITQIEHVADCQVGFLETLQYNLKELPTISNPGHVTPSTDQIAAIQEMLSYLYVNVINLSIQQLEFHLQDIDTVLVDCGLLVYSLYGYRVFGEEPIYLPDTIQGIKERIYYIIRKEFQSNLPRIHGLGYVDFLLNNLKEFQERYSNSLAFVKTQLQKIQNDLESLQPFLRVVAEGLHNNHSKLQHSVSFLIGKAYEVEYIVDACVSKNVPDWCLMLWLVDITEEIRAELVEIQQKNMVKVDLVSHDTLDTCISHTPRTQTQSIEEKIVGFEDVLETLQCHLIKGPRKLQIISIVGMHGAGKTTLANKLYFDESVASHFDTRAQCFVSSVYSQKELLVSILAMLLGSTEEASRLRQDTNHLAAALQKVLRSRRCLILIDDLWNTRVWDDLKHCFHDFANGSRILLTTRDHNVANYVQSVTVRLRLLSYDESWKLLKIKMSEDESSSHLLENVGHDIARSCGGLPLLIVMVAGILSKMEKTETCWRQVAEDLSPYIASDLEASEEAYQNLPYHLKSCFLYFGTFLLDKEINVSNLTWLWIGEGFVKDREDKSLQDIAEGYLEDLIRRDLVIDTKRSSDGQVKACRIHNPLNYYFCRIKAEEEYLLLWVKRDQNANPSSGHKQLVQHRLAFPAVDNLVEWGLSCSPVGSILYREDKERCVSSRLVSQTFYNFKFLKVLDLECVVTYSFPSNLVYLRYFAARTVQKSITPSISNLWNLETLIVKPEEGKLGVPVTIWKMGKLRNVRIHNACFQCSYGEELLEKLDTLSTPSFSCTKDVELLSRKTPNLRELRCSFVDFRDKIFPEFNFLTRLETLKIHLATGSMVDGPYNFPSSVRNLTLSNFFLGSCHESNIANLPNLQILKLVSIFFDQDEWEVNDGEFQKLKVLKLVRCEFFEKWVVSYFAFRNLQHLVLVECPYLKEIPSCFQDKSSLKSIKVKSCNQSVIEAARDFPGTKVEDYQNTDIKLSITGSNLGFDQVMKMDREMEEEKKKKVCLSKRSGKTGTGSVRIGKKKVVLKLDYFNEKVKQKAIKNVSALEGVESISIDKEKKLTVTGNIDPVSLVSKLRKLCHADILSIGPAKEPEKKKEG